MEDQLREIFERITERFDSPVRLSRRCETKVYYHVEDLLPEEIEICAEYVAERVVNVCYPARPDILVNLPGAYTDLALMLSTALGTVDEPLEILTLSQLESSNEVRDRLKNARVMLVNDVITTARSCLRAHSQITMMGASVLCWSALIDRTFGPGPVPIVTSFTGEPITLLEQLA